MRASVLIVDDHAEFRSTAARLLDADGFDVVGSAASGAAALAEVERLAPDVVLLDVRLPDLDGFTVAEQLAARSAPAAVVLISSREESTYSERLATTPARGFIAKRDLSGAAVAALLR
jgi:DNA-binding NarL/FixJ family response regulator